MPTLTVTKAQVPVGSDPYALTADLKKMMETASLVVPVANQAERDGLADKFPTKQLPVPFLITRADLGQQIQVWNGTQWLAGSGVEVVDLPQADTNWNQVARISRTREPAGVKEIITMSLLVNRAGGPNFTIPGYSWWPTLNSIVPAGFRPPASVPAGSMAFVDDATLGTLHAKLDSAGNISFRGVGGDVDIKLNSTIYLSMSWTRG